MKNLNLFVLSLLSIMLFSSCDQLEDIFGNESNFNGNGNYAFVEDYVENFDAVLSPDGHVCLFGVDTRDEVEGEYNKIFFITKANYETGEISSSDEICVVVDSIGMPNIISMEGYNVYISNITNSTFDCIITEEGIENIELKNLPLPKQESYSIKNATRSIASSDAIPLYGLDNLIDDIGKAQAMQAIITAATNKEKLSAGIGAIGTVLGGEAGLTLGGISDALTGSLRNSYLALAGYMWSENQKFILNHIGPWHISIESVEQTDRNTCLVGYTIDGIWDDCEGKPRVYLNCQNSDKNKHTGKVEQALELGYAVNGYHEVEIKNLKAGYYLIEMRLYDECHKVTNLSIRTYPPILLQMADLELSKYEIEENPLYKNGAVNFKMNIFLKGNEDGLNDIQQFGYYIKYANAIDYKEVKNLSSIFESTPLTYELSIPRDGFSDETINYTTFEAKPSIDYYIGVYVVLKNGNIVCFDEEIIEELIYCKKPEIQFTSAHAKSTEVIETYDDGDVRYKTYYTFDCNINGCFWIDYIQYTISQSNVNNYWDPDYPKNDGDYTFNGWAEYTNSAVHNSYFTIYLTNGGTLSSENGLQLSCGGGSGSMSVTGGNTRSLSKSFNTINTNSSINGQLK